MQHIDIPRPTDDRDTFAIRSLLLLSLLLLISTYLYRSLATDLAYEQPLAKDSRPALVQTEWQSSAE